MSVDPSIRGVLWGLLGLVRATAGVLGEAEQLSETGTRVESFVDAFSSPEDDWTSGFLWLCCSITVCNTQMRCLGLAQYLDRKPYKSEHDQE